MIYDQDELAAIERTLRLMLNKGADVDDANFILSRLVEDERMKSVFKILLAYGADPNVKGADDIYPLFTTIVDNVRVLIDVSGIDVNVVDSYSRTPLQWVMLEWNVNSGRFRKDIDVDKIVGMLIEAGANVNAQDGLGETPLMYAISFHRSLVMPGIKDDDGQNILFYVRDVRTLELVVSFLGSCVEGMINEQNVRGETPLYGVAVNNGDVVNPNSPIRDVLLGLLKLGADPTIRNNDDETIYSLYTDHVAFRKFIEMATANARGAIPTSWPAFNGEIKNHADAIAHLYNPGAPSALIFQTAFAVSVLNDLARRIGSSVQPGLETQRFVDYLCGYRDAKLSIS